MQISKETMLEKIYKEIARKDLSFGCKIRNIHSYYKIIEDVPSIVIRRNTKYFWNDLLDISTSKEISHWVRFDEIIWHPVMIGDVLNRVANNIKRNLFTNLDNANRFKVWYFEKIIREFWLNIDKPIEEQDIECIKYVYDLLPTKQD